MIISMNDWFIALIVCVSILCVSILKTIIIVELIKILNEKEK